MRIILVVFFLSTGLLLMAQNNLPRQVKRLNFDWQFKPGQIDSENAWTTVQLPHDASISGGFSKENSTSSNGWLPYSCGTYKKTFFCYEANKNKLVKVQFDGVYRDALVWINGVFLGRQLNGYLGFEYDITPHIHWGKENILVVYYDNTTKGTSRWYTGEGIYRDVWLKIVDKLSIPIYGTFITTPEITNKTSTVVVETEMTNSYNDRKTPVLITEIMDNDNRIVASAKASAIIEANGKCVFNQEIVINNPNLWSTESPNLYKAVSKVYNETVQTDNYETSFGIRNITMTPDRGLLLNGKKVLAVGGNMHHDLGCIGAVALERGYERRLQLLKDMGCNSIRLCHNPHAPVLLDLCDKMGILVFDEAFDLWYSQFYGGVISFMEGCADDIERFIKRDRNHPSVYIWSVGNEVENQYGYFDKKYETQADNPDFGVTRLNYLKSLVKKYDPTRKVTAALLPSRNTGRYFEWEHWDDYETFMKSTPIPMAFHSDVVSWNYTENFFDADHKNYPQMMFIASETATNIRFGERKNSWFEVDTSYLIGYYYWSASDYLGGSQWPTKTWARAFYDISDEQTALGYLYQSFYSKKPMVRIMVYEQDTAIVNRWDRQYQNKRWSWYPMAEHWNWDKHKTVTLSTFTNCEEVELLINGKTQGKKLLKDYKDSVITWNVQYQNGYVKAIGRNKGMVVSEHELVTADAPVKLVLEADRPAIKADGYDLSYIEVKVVDENGVVVPNKDYLVEFDVKGPGYNTGVCNGDIYSDELYQSNKRTTYQGKCLLVVRNEREKGKIIITAKSNGLKPAECVIKAE